MKTLKINKNKVYVFNLIENFDGNNTYKAFNECYYIKNCKRHYFSDMDLKGFNTLSPFASYANAGEDVKQWLNKHHGANIRYMSDFQNIVVNCCEVTTKQFNNLTK